MKIIQISIFKKAILLIHIKLRITQHFQKNQCIVVKNHCTIQKVLLVVVGMTLWALLGNYIYNADLEGYSHFFNWFFVVQDPFSIFPEAVGPYLMPFLNVFLFCLAETLIHWIISLSKREKQ